MICDKCGKSNVSGVSLCAYCGTEMPKTTECAGFADILTVKAAEPVVATVKDESGRVSEVDMKNLLNKTNEIFKNTKFTLAAICICILISVISIIMNVNTSGKLKAYEEKLDTIIENTTIPVVEPIDDIAGNNVAKEETKASTESPESFGKDTYKSEKQDKFEDLGKKAEKKIKNTIQQKKKEEEKKIDSEEKETVEDAKIEKTDGDVEGQDLNKNIEG